ncbi:chain length determinant protein [Streptomyces sp. NPDC048338]|uniref:chain length determinant protein n=1 Tax=Streptomyces sp. NPDC048338 TaxID=3365536 RepID=UPI003724157D
MDLAEIFRVICRRWYVLVPGLLLTAAVTAGAGLMVPTQYESQSTVALLNSKRGTAADGNPYLVMVPALTGMADSLARNLNSDASVAELRERGVTAKYEAKIADNAQGPLLWLTVTGEDQDGVLAANHTLMKYSAEKLEELQATQSVPADSMIRMTTIVPPQKPQAQLKSKIQYLVMAGAAGLVLSLAASFFVEARRRHEALPKHRQNRSRDTDEAPEEESATTQADAGDARAGTRRSRTERPGAGESDGEPAAAGPEGGRQLDQPTVQLPLLPSSERAGKKRPPSWVK